MIDRPRQPRLTVRVVVCGLVLSAVLAGPSAKGATVAPTPSTWIPVAPKQVQVAGVAVFAGRGFIVTPSTQGPLTPVPANRALVVQRRGRYTHVVRRLTLPDDIGSVVAVTPDVHGRWLVLSMPVVNGVIPYNTGRLTRLTAQGVIDTTFGTGGVSSLSGTPMRAASDGEGRPVILMSRTTLPLPGTSTTLVTRLTTSGQTDPTFGSGGTAPVPPPTGRAASILGAPADSLIASPRTLTVTPANAIIVAGTISDIPNGSIGYLTKLTSSGTPDAAFGDGDGTVTYGPFRNDPILAGAFGAAVSVERALGRIYVVGRPNGYDRDLTWRRTADGRRDAAYGTLGWSRPATADPNMQGTATIQGAALCTGGFVQTTPQQIRITTRTGRPDASYGRRGTITVPEKSPLGRIDAAATDIRRCPTDHLAVSARVRHGKGGVTLIWLSLPTR